MKVLIRLLLFMVPAILMAQAPESHQKSFYQGKDGKLFWNRYLPFYLNISSSPDEKGVLLESKDTPKYANPAFFDTEGINFIRTRNAVDRNSMKAVVPAMEIKWEVYADGIAPVTKIQFTDATKFEKDGNVFFGGGLNVALSSTDAMSGLLNTYFTISEKEFVPYNGPIPFTEEGKKFISYYAADHVGNVEPVSKKHFTVDLSPPTTNINIEGITKGNIVATTTRFSLELDDKLSGISNTMIRINDGAPMAYKGGYINKNQLPDGEHTLYFYSTDNVGNVETEHIHKFYLDKLPPIMAADALGDRYVAAGKIYFSGRTKLKITAVDNKSGVSEIFFAINDEEFKPYKEPFYLPSRSGYHVIRYYGKDNMGNISYDNRSNQKFDKFEHNVHKVYVDLTGPTIDYRIDGPKFTKRDTQYISPKSKIYLSGSDQESGLQYLAYSLNGELRENTYSEPFSVKNDGIQKIEYFGYDNVNNRNKKEDQFVIDGTPPEIFHNFSVPSFAKNSDGVSIFPSYVKLYIGATDHVTGNEKLLVSINGAPFKNYTGQISGFKPNVVNEVKIKAVDKVGNQRTHIVQFIIE